MSMFAYDLHLHTRRYSVDSAINPFSLVRHAENLGLSGLVITEHDQLWNEEELDELRAVAPGLNIFAGVEVSAYEGHFLCYGVMDHSVMRKGIPLRELCYEVHAQGGVVIAAHPYRWGQNFDDILMQEPLLDGLEVMSSHMDAQCRNMAQNRKSERKGTWAALGNSDAHQLDVVACCYSIFPQALRDQEDLLEALRSGQVEARERQQAYPTR